MRLMWCRRVGAGSCLLVGLLLCWPWPLANASASDADGASPLRQVILISCDTLSAQHLQAYGYGKATTYTFDALLSRGVLFRHCLTPQMWTLPAHLSMLTGLAPGVHRAGKYRGLSPAIPLLTEILQQHGFRTGGFPTANEWLKPSYGFGRGFDRYTMFGLDDESLEISQRWVEGRTRRVDKGDGKLPFFLFYHYMDVHSRPHTYPSPYWPLQKPALTLCELDRRQLPKQFLPVEVDDLFGDIENWDLSGYDVDYLRCSYDACITAWDNFQLRILLEGLSASGHLNDTLVIITADHGEELGEHGGYYHDSPYGEVREVPLLMIWPGRLPAGAVVDRRVSLVDLAPTILDLAGLQPLPVCQGRSLRPLLENLRADWPVRDFLVDGNCRGWRLLESALVAYRDGHWWSLVARTDTTGTIGTFAPARVDSVIGLFNLTSDPQEQVDLQQRYPELVRGLGRDLERQLAAEAELARELDAGSQVDELEISEEEARKLKALGY